MTHIEFYILFGAEHEDRLAYARTLALKALAGNRSVHIHTACAKDTRSLISDFQHLDNADDLTIDHKGEPESDSRLLINLAAEVPYFFSRFETTCEVVHDESTAREMARERYRFYQERGYPLTHREVQAELV